jgi:hypothetical protein
MPTRSRRPAWRWPRWPGLPGPLRGERCLIRTPKRPAGRPVSSRRVRLGAASCLSDARARRQAPVSGPPDSPVHRCWQGPDLTAVSRPPAEPAGRRHPHLVHMPRTGSFLIVVAPVLRPSCKPRRPAALGGEADGGSRRRRRAARIPARTAPVPSASSACIRGQVPEPVASSRAAGDAGPGSSGAPDPRQAAARPRRTSWQGRPAAVQLAGLWQDVAARRARTLSRRHAE